MASTRPLQSAFTSGVLAPGFAARTEIQHYYQGMRTGRNVLCVKEGGVRGRWGLRWIGQALGAGRLIEFNFSPEQVYLLVFTHQRVQFYRNGALIPDINGSGNDWLATPWTTAQLAELDYAQEADTVILTHREVEQRRLVRGADHDEWTISAVPTINVPELDFNDADSPTPTSHVVDLTFTDFDEGNRYRLELNNFETPEITYTAASTAANERRIQAELLLLPPTGFAEASITVAHTGGTTYRITFSGESADAYEPMTGRNTDKTTGSITTTTITPGVARREPIWSAVRGWARTCAFYEGRLYFGGVFELPAALIGSVVGDFFNFDQGTGLDDQGIFLVINQAKEIRGLYPGRHLQVFASGGEFYTPDRPVLPNSPFPRQSKFGSAAGIKPQEIDGATIFATRQRKTVREYLFLWAEEAYNATSLTVMASDLVRLLRDMAAQTSTEDDEDSYLIGINEDGSAATLNTLRSQDIAAWSEMTTRAGDRLRQVAVVGDEIYFLIERQVNGSTVHYIELADFTTRMDAARTVTTGLGTTVGGFAHLAGETVQILVDGGPVADQVVNGAGELTFTTAPASSVEAGFFVPPVVETMPLVVDLGFGPLLGMKKRLANIRLRVLNSLGIIANGRAIPDMAPGATQLGAPPPPFTGKVKIGDMGWSDDDATITLTQEQPLPFHVLAVAGDLEVGDG